MTAKDTLQHETQADRKNNTLWFPLSVLSLAVAAAFAYAGAVTLGHWEADHAEYSIQSFLVRLERYAYGSRTATLAITGSSFSVELNANYFQKMEAVNLAAPGCSPQLGCQLLARYGRHVPVVLVEENSSFLATGELEPSILEACGSPQFRLARWMPFLRASYRPSSIFYSWLYHHAENRTPQAGHVVPAQNEHNNRIPDPDFLAQIQALRAQGTRVVFYRLPAGARSLFGPSLAVRTFGSGVEFVDIAAAFEAGGYIPRYKDSSHLTASSAMEAVKVLEAVIEKQK